jgi:hypothetical protein
MCAGSSLLYCYKDLLLFTSAGVDYAKVQLCVEHAEARLAVIQMQPIECIAFMIVIIGTGLPRMQEHLPNTCYRT